ncbi:hypothetical protein F4678DRAFT_17772 [Xylaria arbuscula]|nr:hypothetical protein F4678DRAFT_17772 [Xylaria arbuscula]
MIKFYTNYIDLTSPTRAKLVVQLIAQGVDTELEDIKLANHGLGPVSDGTVPTLITSVRDFKAGLAVSAGARPVQNLGKFLWETSRSERACARLDDEQGQIR